MPITKDYSPPNGLAGGMAEEAGTAVSGGMHETAVSPMKHTHTRLPRTRVGHEVGKDRRTWL